VIKQPESFEDMNKECTDLCSVYLFAGKTAKNQGFFVRATHFLLPVLQLRRTPYLQLESPSLANAKGPLKNHMLSFCLF